MARWRAGRVGPVAAPHGRRDGVDLTVAVGGVTLRGPVLPASGTAGHGAELGRYVDLASLGAVVVKSLSADPWPGNRAPRVHETAAGMINSVGLQGPGVAAWLAEELPALLVEGATVVASIWGRTLDDFALAAEAMAAAPPEVVAVEVNVSCPNLHAGGTMFAQDPGATRAALEATAACGRPRWAKLSPAVADLVPVAAAAAEGGAEAVVLVNTVPGLAIDPETRRPRLGGGGGGLSGPAIHPVAVRAVHDVHAALPALPLVGVGGVASGEDAVELLLAGASVVEVGTASFADPRATARIAEEVAAWCAAHGVTAVRDLTGGAHAR
jgi:dihydroorotate dehydrogenase (NAD+) catalytic subunit